MVTKAITDYASCWHVVYRQGNRLPCRLVHGIQATQAGTCGLANLGEALERWGSSPLGEMVMRTLYLTPGVRLRPGLPGKAHSLPTSGYERIASSPVRLRACRGKRLDHGSLPRCLLEWTLPTLRARTKGVGGHSARAETRGGTPARGGPAWATD